MTEISRIDNDVLATAPRRERAWISLVFLEFFAVVSEAAIVLSSSIIGGIVYHLVYYGGGYNIDGFFGIGLVGAVLHILIAKSQDLYAVPVLAGLDRRWTRLVSGWLLVVLLLMLFIFLLKIGAGVSRGSMMTFGAIGCAALITARALAQRPLRRAIDSADIAGRRAVLVGSIDELARLRSRDLLQKFGLTEVLRFNVSDDPDEMASSGQDSRIVAIAIEAARANQVDEIVLAMRWDQEGRIQRITEQLRISPLPVHLLPDSVVERFLSLPTVSAGLLPILEVQRAPLTMVERTVKRSFDIIAASLILVFFLPLLTLTAILIKMESPGPFIFRQRRNGFNGQSFSILKFRTMTVTEDDAAIVQAKQHDPRVTPLGRILRRRSIDELPQLINVLRGDMSLVGPRPHALVQNDKYSKLISSYAFRHHMKPGITGLAQVHGMRGETPRIEDMEKRVEYDLAYINEWSFLLDLRILFRTLGEPFRRGVY